MNILRIPRAMTEPEIYEQINRFATTAELAVKAGFDGVQVHAAHGYLLSQFCHHSQMFETMGGVVVLKIDAVC